jgi:N-acetylglucosamine-6-sulfatase
MMEGKDTAYEEDIRVPFAVRGPGVPAGRRVGAMGLGTDLAPTFADWAGVEAPDFVDGRSLAPVLREPTIPWRRSFLVQRQGLESDERLQPASALALRTSRHTYVAYDTTERELYDLAQDPHQLQNIEPAADGALVDALVTRLVELRGCRGRECRELEDLPVEEGTGG